MEGDGVAVVIDNGSCQSRAGFAGEEVPRAIIPSVLGRPRKKDTGKASQSYTHFGDEALSNRGTLHLRYPVEHGVITDWDGMEKLWGHIFHQELKINPENHPVLLSEHPVNPRCNREKMAEVMFETFNVPALYLASHATLAITAFDRTTGIVVDIGDSVIHTAPVYERCTLQHTVHHLDIGGRDLSSFLLQLLQKRGYHFDTASDRERVNEMKEKVCYVSLNFSDEVASFSSSSFENCVLSDGQVITLGAERIQCPEVLFQPSLIGMEMPGVHKIAQSSINKCSSDIVPDMYGNVVLVGGTALLPGIAERMRREITALAPDSVQVRVTSPSPTMGNHSVWSGGSKLASLPSFRDMCVGIDDYNEYGPCLVRRKCF